jgi:large subunit ribosomal protein L21
LPPNLLIYIFGLWRKTIYAIIESGSKQYKVSPGQTIDVERLGVSEGNSVDLEKVLLIADGNSVTVGRPTVAGARVVATSQGETKGEKLIVFKYKPKVRYHKKTGHRQLYTRLAIEEIVAPGGQKTAPKKKASRPKKEVTKDGS